MPPPADSASAPDRARFERLLEDLRASHFRGSLHLNVGFWEAGTESLPAASDALIDRLVEGAPATRELLEIACGAGGGARRLAARFPAAPPVALDRSLSQLARWPAAPRSRSGRICADAGALPFGPARFDLVVTVEAAFLFADRAAFLREARRVLRGGGRLVLSDLLFDPAAFGRGMDWDWLVPAANRELDLAGYAALLRDCGFEPERVEDATAPCWGGFCAHLRRGSRDAGAARLAALAELEASVSAYLLLRARAVD